MTLPDITTETVTTLIDALSGIWCGDLSRTALDRAIDPCSAQTLTYFVDTDFYMNVLKDEQVSQKQVAHFTVQ